MTIMVMPMAGDGKRMASISDTPKPLIEINGYPMFYWAAKNIPADKKVFIVRLDHIEKYSIDKTILNLFPEAIISVQNTKLDGQLLSILVAREYIDSEESLFLVDCDMYSDVKFDDFFDLSSTASILTFSSDLPNYSYVVKNGNMVDSIIEKNVISNNAVGGVFYWHKAKDFLKYSNICINKNVRTNNEFYVSSTYSEAILDGRIIKTLSSGRTYDLSTISGMSLFLEHINKNDKR